MSTPNNLSNFLWSVADLLRGNYRQSDYGSIILPFTVLRRIDCVLAPTKEHVLKEAAMYASTGLSPELIIPKVIGLNFYNLSPLDFGKLLADPANIKANLLSYLQGFSSNVRDIFDSYEFPAMLDRLETSGILYMVVQRFASVDLHPDSISNADMGLVFEELLRRFAESVSDDAGQFFTPREVIRLMVNLLFSEDAEALTQKGVIRTIYDPTAGTGGMLSIAEEYLKHLNPAAEVVLFGQEMTPETYAICKGDMLIKGQDISNIKLGDTLANDGLPGRTFDYCLSNPPYGVDWKQSQEAVVQEHQRQGYAGRFGPGLPRINDGSMLFVLHLVAKMPRVEVKNGATVGGGRVGVVLNSSPLFTGDAGSGESEIRRYLLENDLVECIVGLPTDMFYNTGISTYVWVLSNRKSPERRGCVQLIDATSMFVKMRKPLSKKNKELSPEDIEAITAIHGNFEEGEYSKILRNEEFGYRQITVERPLRLRFELTAEKIAALESTKLTAQDTYGQIVKVLRSFPAGKVWMSRDKFLADLKTAGLSLSPAAAKLLVQELGEQSDDAEVCRDKKGNPEPSAALRDTENVPLVEDVDSYFRREVLPHAPDAWIDHDKAKVGYEIPFTRHFYKYVPPRNLDAIDADLKASTAEILSLLQEVMDAS